MPSNPWLAIGFAVVPAAYVAVLAIIALQEHKSLAKLVLLIVGVAAALGGFVAFARFFGPGLHFYGSGAELINLPLSYSATSVCTGGCSSWKSNHEFSVVLSDNEVSLADRLVSELGQDGWAFVRETTEGEAGMRLHFENRSSIQNTPVGWWPMPTTHDIELPAELTGAQPILAFPPGAEAAALVNPVYGDADNAMQNGLHVDLYLDSESELKFQYPRLAILATTPSSEPKDLAGRRQERTLRLSDTDNNRVSVDLVAPYLRSDPAVKFITLGVTGWAWLIAASLGSLLFKQVRAFLGVRAKRILAPVMRGLAVAKPVGRHRRPERKDEVPADTPGGL